MLLSIFLDLLPKLSLVSGTTLFHRGLSLGDNFVVPNTLSLHVHLSVFLSLSFETGSLFIALDILELAMQAKLT